MEDHAKQKLKSIAEDYPDTLALVMIKVTEFSHPLPASAASPIAKAHIGELVLKEKWLPLLIPGTSQCSTLCMVLPKLLALVISILLFLRK